MPISELSAIERIARVLAGQRLSVNAKGNEASAAQEVDENWFVFRDDAIAILRTLREPDPVMAEAGDAQTWKQMVDAAIDDFARSGPAEFDVKLAG
jgi:hypothetical protein